MDSGKLLRTLTIKLQWKGEMVLSVSTVYTAHWETRIDRVRLSKTPFLVLGFAVSPQRSTCGKSKMGSAFSAQPTTI